MSAMDLLCHVIGIDSRKLSKEENKILEAELYTRICEEIKDIYKIQYKDYFRVFKFNSEMEDTMIESNFFRLLINEILQSEAYTLTGIARYTQTPEDVIQDLLIRSNTLPTLLLPRKLIELHRLIQPDLYRGVLKKIAAEKVA